MTATVLALPRQARVLRLEIRKSVIRWSVPLLVGLFFFDAYRTAMGLPAVWTARSSVITSSVLDGFVVFGTGLAAWAGSREGRRRTCDMVITTGRPAWARQGAALGATMFWLLLVYFAEVTVLYAQTARQATWGGPPLWPVTVGAMGVVMVTVLGFTLGAIVPSRFTAPLASVSAFLLYVTAFHESLNVTPTSGKSLLLSPGTGAPLGDDGVFYHAAPDVAIAQVMFIGGTTVALLGVLALFPLLRGPYRGLFAAAINRTGRSLCVAAVALLATGIAAAWTAFALTGTAQLGVSGWAIPALHDTASDQPVPYTPDCTGTAFKMCLHPAFASYLGSANAALQPVAAEIAGLPGAPVGTAMVAAGDGVYGTDGLSSANPSLVDLNGFITGAPPVYVYTSDAFWAQPWGDQVGTRSWDAGFEQQFLTAFFTQPRSSSVGSAQQAVITALMGRAGYTPHRFQKTDDSATWAQVAAAVQRFEALSPGARHAWLASHLPALRAGQVTPAEIP
jgi:hypothetical protein